MLPKPFADWCSTWGHPGESCAWCDLEDAVAAYDAERGPAVKEVCEAVKELQDQMDGEVNLIFCPDGGGRVGDNKTINWGRIAIACWDEPKDAIVAIRAAIPKPTPTPEELRLRAIEDVDALYTTSIVNPQEYYDRLDRIRAALVAKK